MPQATEVCCGCGITLPVESGPTHPYMLGSVACWRGYGELLAAQYSDPERMRFHQVVVDAYAVQHPDGDDPRAVQSVAIHLMTLALFLERGVDPALGTRLHGQMLARPVFHRLERPGEASAGGLTFRYVPLEGDAIGARERAYEWARQAWASWGPCQEVVWRWITASGLA
jgi:Family of unknown function (DUF5946)